MNGFMTDPGSKRSVIGTVAPVVGLALGVVVRVVPGDAREGEDLAREGIDHDEGAALRLVGVHRRVDLALGDVLDPLVDREGDVVALKGLALAAALEDEAAAPVAQAVHLLDLAAQVLVERELEPVLALRVGGHETQQRPGELAAWIIAMALALDRQAMNGVRLALRIAEVAHRLGLVSADATLDPHEAPSRSELGVDLGGVERERFPDARGGVAHGRLLRSVAVHAPQQVRDVDADARDLDAHRERSPIAVVDGAPFRLDVQAALPLLLGHVAPLGAVLDLDTPRARDDGAEREAHDPAEDAHARADPPGTTGVEVLHGSPCREGGGAPLRPRTGGPLSPAAACAGIAGMATIRSGGGGSMPSRDSGDDLDALGGLVARRLELEDAVNLAQVRLLLACPSELVSELHRPAAQREVHDERAHRGCDSEGPQGKERRTDAPHSTSPSSTSRRAARSFALRARALTLHSSSVGACGLRVKGVHGGRTNARLTSRSSSD